MLKILLIPLRDKEIVDLELQIKDLEIVDKQIDKILKKLRAGYKDDVKFFISSRKDQK